MENLKISDWIQVIAIIVTLFIATISFVQTQRSLKMTQRTIDEANRPYISIYIETIDTIRFEKYIVIKNFGATSAQIIELTFDGELDGFNQINNLQSLVFGNLAPKQKYTSSLETSFNKTISTTIKYLDFSGKEYSETFTLKTDISNDLLWSRYNSKNESDETIAIKQAAQVLIKTIK